MVPLLFYLRMQKKRIAIVRTNVQNNEKICTKKEDCYYGKVGKFICENRAGD